MVDKSGVNDAHPSFHSTGECSFYNDFVLCGVPAGSWTDILCVVSI